MNYVIIGGGHNGLVAAAYLARAGAKSVTVLEQRSILGGCSSTEKLWPGFKISPAAYVISLFLPTIIDDLKLKEHGLTILPRNPSSYTPDLNGFGLLLTTDREHNYHEIAHYNQSDAQHYEDYELFLEQIASVVEPLLMEPPPMVFPFGKKKGPLKKLMELNKARRLFKKFSQLGELLPEAVELLTGAAAPILHRYFQTDILKATLATDAIIGSFTSPNNPGSAYVLLHHVMGESGGARGVWGCVRGGMGGLADALEKSCINLGVTIVREAPVIRVDVDESNRVRGVFTEDQGFYPADVVASSVDATGTMNFLEKSVLKQVDPLYLKRIRNIDYASASAKINLALDKLPSLHGAKIDDHRDGFFNGTIHLCPNINYIEEAYHDGMMGRISANPVLEVTIPSAVDNTLAPAGRHVMSIFTQYVPYETPEYKKDDFFKSCLQVLQQYFPDIENCILEKQIMFPADLERIYGLTGGNIFQGAMSLHQMGPFRTHYETPINGLYLCGAATHPGGGVIGACGRNAVKTILLG